MTTRPVPARHWKSYGDDPLPTGREALGQPFRAFPSWFLRITCDRCGKDRMLNEAHTPKADMLLSYIIAKMRHADCGGRAARVELLTGIEGASNRPMRRIVLHKEQRKDRPWLARARGGEFSRPVRRPLSDHRGSYGGVTGWRRCRIVTSALSEETAHAWERGGQFGALLDNRPELEAADNTLPAHRRWRHQKKPPRGTLGGEFRW